LAKTEVLRKLQRTENNQY